MLGSARDWERVGKGAWVGQPFAHKGKGKGNDHWYAIIKRADAYGGKRRMLRCDSKDEAENVAREHLGLHRDVPTVTEVLDFYAEDHVRTLRRRTRNLNCGYINNHLKPFFGVTPISTVSTSMLFDFGESMLYGLDLLQRQKRFSVLRNCLVLLRGAMNHYWMENPGRVLNVRNPAVLVRGAVDRIRVSHNIQKNRRRQAYTREELITLVGVARKNGSCFVGDLICVGAGTGMRLGEILGLRWDNIDFDEMEIKPDSDGNLHAVDDLGNPVLYKSDRDAPIQVPSGVMEIFKAYFFPRHDYVFCDISGNPFKMPYIQREIREVRLAAIEYGVPMSKSFHSTRHAFASIALNSGKDLAWVANQLNHHNPAFTGKVYSHVIQKKKEDMSWADLTVIAA